MHAGRGLALWACGWCAAAAGDGRAGRALRLLLSLRLWLDGAAGAVPGFVHFARAVPGLVRFIAGLRPHKTGGARQTNGVGHAEWVD